MGDVGSGPPCFIDNALWVESTVTLHCSSSTCVSAMVGEDVEGFNPSTDVVMG